MFQVNDNVVYGNTGVCRIDEIKTEITSGQDVTEYYVLHPIFGSFLKIMTPVHNPHVMIRAILNHEEVSSLINDMPVAGSNLANDETLRREKYKLAMRTGDCREWIQLIDVLSSLKNKKAAAGKKLSTTDENILKSAQRMLCEEFSVSLKIPVGEVLGYIRSHVPQSA